MSETENKDSDVKVVNKKKGFFARARKFIIVVLIVSLLSSSVITTQPKTSEAFVCFCVGILCDFVDVLLSAAFWLIWKLIWTAIILENIEDHINSEENWIVEEFFEDFFVKGLAEMTEYLSAFGLYQTYIFGTFLDAKEQLERQRLFWKLHAEAHKDYHPSDDYCWFGTNARSLAATEDRANFARSVMSKRSLARQLGNVNSVSAPSEAIDKESRWRKFVTTYCDPKDNNWSDPVGGVVPGTGLDMACDHDGSGPGVVRGATDVQRVNRDIDYTRLMEIPRTLEVNFDSAAVIPVPADEEDVLAMASNLYGNKVLTRILSGSILKNNQAAQNAYLALRTIAAKRSVAENSFNAIVALKAAGTGATASTAPAQQVRQYMASLIRDLMPAATTDAEIYEMIGQNPSYYAQLELLSKKIYENPDFYANLYDSPANIARKSVAMKAIEMMLDRALLETELRQEMVMSVLLSGELRQRYRTANKNLQAVEK
jgi:hypothetical protein